MIAISGATGRLGEIVVRLLRERHLEITTVALVRDTNRGQALGDLGAELRPFDYDRPETLADSLAGVEKLLLISGNAVGQRERQHRSVIEAARAAGVKLIAYTSVLRASETGLSIATEHRATEAVLADVGVPHTLLRHGWYCENFIFRIKAAIGSGILPTCAGHGLISGASRLDYAEAAVAILTSPQDQGGLVYELAGSTSFTFDDLAREAATASRTAVEVVQMEPKALEAYFIDIQIPAVAAALIVKSDIGAREGGLFDASRTLERLIGRETVPVSTVIAEALG